MRGVIRPHIDKKTGSLVGKNSRRHKPILGVLRRKIAIPRSLPEFLRSKTFEILIPKSTAHLGLYMTTTNLAFNGLEKTHDW